MDIVEDYKVETFEMNLENCFKSYKKASTISIVDKYHRDYSDF